MRYLIGYALFLFGVAAHATDISAALWKELNRPEVDEHGCALVETTVIRDGYAYNKDFYGEDGVLSSCGAHDRSLRDGYWVFMDTGFYLQGWYRQGEQVGTWLATSPAGWLAAVYRYDKLGGRHGISYGLGEYGQLIWRRLHSHDRLVMGCGENGSPC